MIFVRSSCYSILVGHCRSFMKERHDRLFMHIALYYALFLRQAASCTVLPDERPHEQPQALLVYQWASSPINVNGCMCLLCLPRLEITQVKLLCSRTSTVYAPLQHRGTVKRFKDCLLPLASCLCMTSKTPPPPKHAVPRQISCISTSTSEETQI